MTAVMHLALEAHDASRNVHRRYEVEVGDDLFGELLVVVRFGRAGSRLRALRFGGLSKEDAVSVVRARLRRRMAAHRRVGCAYRLCDDSILPVEGVGEWMPPELLSGRA